jgi:hypothetical protein
MTPDYSKDARELCHRDFTLCEIEGDRCFCRKFAAALELAHKSGKREGLLEAALECCDEETAAAIRQRAKALEGK